MARHPENREETVLSWIVLAHVATLALFTPWAFGGNAAWSRTIVSVWAALGAGLTLWVFIKPAAGVRAQALRWLAPWLLLNLAVLTSAWHPNLHPATFGQETVLLPTTGISVFWPSSAQPLISLQALGVFDGIYLSCINLALTVRRRRSLRGLFTLAAANAAVLAIFGSFQKLGHCRGLFFGLVPSPQPAFFASFIYHNHWGAYAILMTAVFLGLIHQLARDQSYRDFWHSPAPLGLTACALLVLSIPLSTSRSGTVLVLMLLVAALVVAVLQLRKASRGILKASLLAGSALVALTLCAWVAQPIISQRLDKTSEQVAELRARGDFGSRQQLYRDTWHMAVDRPLFGWGLGSYPLIFFYRYNTQDSLSDRLPVYYEDAHSDWLQALAEIGFIGTGLLGLVGLVPLFSLRGTSISLFPAALLTGCVLILTYAWIEFPFGNLAVVITWWMCFFGAIHYARLERHLRSAPSRT